MQLSKNFSLEELCKSYEGERKGIDNTPSIDIVDNLKLLANNILQPIRDTLGPVIIKSGYRSPTLNRLVGGVPSSDHVLGLAADIEISNMSNYNLASWCIKNLVFKQVILEFYTRGNPNSGWVHISYGNKKQVLTAVKENGKTVYITGLAA